LYKLLGIQAGFCALETRSNLTYLPILKSSTIIISAWRPVPVMAFVAMSLKEKSGAFLLNCFEFDWDEIFCVMAEVRFFTDAEIGIE
jgi:hypothetical protein